MENESEISTKANNAVVYSPREAILHSADLLRSTIQVQGTVVLVDNELGRMDLTEGGAKLITRLPASSSSDSEGENSSRTLPQLEEVVIVSGVLRKEQRRTFLMVSEILPPLALSNS